ncbi:thiol-disulfide isomerase/thioredoxin [Virgibacillus natechei]|uniref:Thiol-disulfide isomerase/thioredoxin n=1 Tax=Virgibacillus natechei TaxID=1216297 RepID=A0ABS4IDH0_9BACI|nr:thioredoxin family protein [Virgibacillus natechei]MBP1968992.1 thiol-disulfide isomerase/thioredoxin [Virgibacillus natechei]UZD14268.1 thioredoxin family protein [Virgibacillus natechei]
MKKKMLIFGGIIVALFAALFFVTNYQNNQAMEDSDNPYGKSDLNQATIDQLDDPLYENQVLPEELSESMDNGEEETVYFYDPTCVYCQEATPVLVPLAEDLDIDLKKLNLLEFDDQWIPYNIESTPTVVHYENGQEVARIGGSRPEAEFEAFFNQHVLN